MTDQEINHYIATQINGWIHDEGIFYHDVNGATCYLADYCNSIPHALDIAKTNGIGLKPVESGWEASLVNDPSKSAIDFVASKAICLTALILAGVGQ